MQRVIGLDIGSFSIKAVEIVNTLKSYEIVNFYENVVPPIEDIPMEAIVPACMEQLFRENKLEADRIVTAMPGQFISSRLLSFGFSDPKKIETAVYAELEDAVPFNMEDMIVDYQILGTVNNQTITLAAMTRKAFLANFLDLLQRINIDPKIVDIDSLALYNLSAFLPVEPGRSFAMVDVGHEKTSVCIVRDGVLRLFRSINLGGRYITEFLARDLEVTFPEAQRVKHRMSRVLCHDDSGDDLSGDDYLIVERTTLAANAIIKELGRTFYSFKTWDKDPLSCVYISGGTVKTKNFDKLMADQLEVEVRHCALDQTELKINSELSEKMIVMPQSIAIGLRSVSVIKKHSQINLRKGEFAYVQNYQQFLHGVFLGLKVAAVVLLLLGFSYGLKYYFYSKNIDELHKRYQREYAEISKDKAKKRRSNMSFEKLRRDSMRDLRDQITRLEQAVGVFKRENEKSLALTLLKDISQAVPKSLEVELTRYEFVLNDDGDGKLILSAEAKGYTSLENMIEALRTIPSLADVKETRTVDKPGSEKLLSFTIEARVPIEQVGS